MVIWAISHQVGCRHAAPPAPPILPGPSGHPRALAKCWAQLEANAGKYLAAETAFEACHTAMLTLGGMGYAQEYHVERLLREILIPRTAPVSSHMVLNFIAEKVLELPKSY